MSKAVEKSIEQYLQAKGLLMIKVIVPNNIRAASFEVTRTVYSVKEMKLAQTEGYFVDGDVGLWLFNALFHKKLEEKN